MGEVNEKKIKISMKDEQEDLNNGINKKTFNEFPKIDEINDSKGDQIKIENKNSNLLQDILIEKEERKWSKINWNYNISEEKIENKWNKIDWRNNNPEEQIKNKWNKITWNNKYSENVKIEGNKNTKSKDIMVFKKNGDIITNEFRDFTEDPKDGDIKEILLEDKNKLKNESYDEIRVEDFKNDTNEEGAKEVQLNNSEHKLEEREKKINNLNVIRKSNEKVEIKGDTSKYGKLDNKITTLEKKSNNGQDDKELKSPKYCNLIDEEVQKKFYDYYKNTGKYPNWGLKLKKDFWKSIISEKKTLKKELATNKFLNNDEQRSIKQQILSINQILLKCKSLEENHEIQEFIIDKIGNTDLSHQKISELSNKFGINVNRHIIKNISNSISDEKPFLTTIRGYKWEFLDVDRNGQPLKYEKKVEEASKYLINEILTEGFKRKNNLGHLQKPTKSLLKKEHGDFISALYHRTIHLTDVLKQAGYSINKERYKWSFLDYDDGDIPLSYEEQVKKAGEFLINNILTEDFKMKYNLGVDDAPTIEILSKEHSDYYSALHIRKISYIDVIDNIGIKVNYQIGKWKFLDYDDKGNLLSPSDQLQKAADYLKREILTESFKEQHGLEENQSPTIDILQIDHLDYVGAFKRRGLFYNDILEKAALIPNCEFGKWEFLEYDENGIQLSYSEQVKRASQYLKNNILSPDYITKNKLGIEEAPSISMLQNEYGDFCAAVIKRKIYYNDIIEKLGYQPHDIQNNLEIGRSMHIIMEQILLEHTRFNNNCISFYEPFPNIKSEKKHLGNLYGKYKLSHCDNGIIIDKNFKNLSKEIKNLCNERKDLKMINIDYYLGNSRQKSREKCLKGYQGKGRLLILVPTHANSPQPPPENIPYSNNVKILDPLSFTEFIDYNGNLRQDFINCVELAKKSTWDDDYREKLIKLAELSKEIIKNSFNFGQKQLEEYINSTPNLSLNLLRYIPDNSVMDNWINQKNEK